MTFSFMVAPKTAVCFYLSHETGQAEIIQNFSAYFSLWEQYIQMSLAGKPQQSLQVDKNVLSPLFFSSQCIDSNGRTFILVSKQCPILNNSMLSLPTFHFIRRQIARQKPQRFFRDYSNFHYEAYLNDIKSADWSGTLNDPSDIHTKAGSFVEKHKGIVNKHVPIKRIP